jgi:translocation and assembly module TamB
LVKRHIVRNVLIGIAAALACLAIAIVIVINTAWFHNFLRSEISKQALERAGAHVEVGSIATHWTRVAFALNNVVIYGSPHPAANEPPLFRAARLQVGIEFWPLLHKHIELSELILDEPVVHLRINAQGHSNLPVSPHPSTTPEPQELFNLEIRDCALNRGEIFYNDAATPIDAQFHDVHLAATYSPLNREYSGSFSYDKGLLVAKTYGPIDNALQVKFVATRSGVSLSPLVLTTTASRLALDAHLTNYQEPQIEGTYQGSLAIGEIANVLHSTSLPEGTAAVSGKLAYRAGEQQPFIAAVSVQGQAQSNRLEFHASQQPIAATAVSAEYDLSNANLNVQSLVADVLGGHARGKFEMQHMDAPHALSHLDASLQGVSLERASDELASRDVRRLPFVGTTNLALNATWSGTLKDAVAHARLAISSAPQRINTHAIPVNGLVQVDYDGPQNSIRFGQSHLETAKTQFSIAGTLSSQRGGHSTVTMLATTSDLSEAAELGSIISNAMSTSTTTSRMPSLSGSASLTARATGSLKSLRIQARLTASNLSVDASHWRSLALNVNATSAGVALQDGDLIGDGKVLVTFSGRAGLRDWALSANSALALHASVANMPLATVQEIARVKYPVTGILAANISLSGTRASPEGKGTLTLEKASAWNQPINSVTVNAQSHGGTIESSVNLQIPAGTVSANASYTLATQRYELKLQGDAIKLADISALQRRGTINGVANLTASGSGTIRDPQLQAQLAIPQLQTQGQTISGIAAQVNVANEHAAFQLHSVVYNGSVQAKGDVALTGEHYTTASLDVLALPIATVAADFLPSQGSQIGGQTEIHLTLSGPLKTPKQMQAQLRIPTLTVTYGKAQLGLQRPLVADYRNGTLTVNPSEIAGTGTQLAFSGTVPIASKAAYSVTADGSLNLGVVQQFAPEVESSGEVEIHLHSAGEISKPTMKGELQVKNAVFATTTLPVGIEGLNAQVNLSGDRADIAHFSGTVGGGTVTAHGFATIGHGSEFNVGLNAESVRILYPAGLRSVLSGQINFRGEPTASFLTGRVLVNNISFTRQFDISSFAGAFSETAGGTPSSAFQQNMKLNVAVVSTQEINLASNKLSVGGSANLDVIGTMAQPVVLGRIVLNSGEVFFLGKRFEIQSGTVEFANPVRTEPVVRMYITTTIEQYNITLNLNGPFDRLQTNYTSDPALPPADIIHLLAFGNTTEEANAAPSQSVAMGAESVLAQGVGSQVAGKLENLTGISQLTIDPLATNNSGQPGQQISIQERVTGSLLFTFSTNVTTTQGQTIELQYNLNKAISATVLRDEYGGYAIDLRWHKAF